MVPSPSSPQPREPGEPREPRRSAGASASPSAGASASPRGSGRSNPFVHGAFGLSGKSMRTNLFVLMPVMAMALSYGAISDSMGFEPWQTLVLALASLSGAAELTFVGVIGAGGAPVLAVLAGLLVNSRNFAFGLSVGPFVPQDWRALPAAHFVNDESTAFARSQRTDAHRWAALVLMGATFVVAWPVGALSGQWIGSVIDAGALGLDVAFPVILLALMAGDLRPPPTLVAVLLGVLIAVLCTPFLPSGLAPVAALLGLVPVALVLRGARSRKGL